MAGSDNTTSLKAGDNRGGGGSSSSNTHSSTPWNDGTLRRKLCRRTEAAGEGEGGWRRRRCGRLVSWEGKKKWIDLFWVMMGSERSGCGGRGGEGGGSE